MLYTKQSFAKSKYSVAYKATKTSYSKEALLTLQQSTLFPHLPKQYPLDFSLESTALESILLEGRGLFFISCLIIHTQPSVGNEYKKVEWITVERVDKLCSLFLESRTNIKQVVGLRKGDI